MTIYVQITDNERITIRYNDDSAIHLGWQNRATDSQERIMKSGSMAWKTGMQILQLTCSPEDTPEENMLQFAKITDAHENNIAEIEVSKEVQNFFRDEMDDILANKKQIAKGFDWGW